MYLWSTGQRGLRAEMLAVCGECSSLFGLIWLLKDMLDTITITEPIKQMDTMPRATFNAKLE